MSTQPTTDPDLIDAVTLEGSRDRQSGLGIFPRVPAQSPSSGRYDPLVLSSIGTLYSFTMIHPNPKTGQPPFVLAYVDFPQQARVFGRLDAPSGERPVIGAAVRTVADPDHGGGAYKFIPVQEIK